jgi:hypothetical protein
MTQYAQPPEPPVGALWWRSHWRRLIATVLTVGALAGALGSVRTLWPSDVEDRAAFGSVTTRVPIRLSEYRARLTLEPREGSATRRAHPRSAVLVAATAPGESVATEPQKAFTARTRTAVTSATATGAPTSSGGGDEETPAMSATTTRPSRPTEHNLPNLLAGIDQEVARRAPQYVVPKEPDCRPQERSCRIALREQAALDPEGKVVEPDVAAERIATLLRSIRTAPLHGKREPVGALITANLALDGFKDEWLSLTWSMYVEGSTSPLFGAWLRTTAAYQIKPSTDHDSATLGLWVPLPRKHGTYTVALTLRRQGVAVASIDTPVLRS